MFLRVPVVTALTAVVAAAVMSGGATGGAVQNVAVHTNWLSPAGFTSLKGPFTSKSQCQTEQKWAKVKYSLHRPPLIVGNCYQMHGKWYFDVSEAE